MAITPRNGDLTAGVAGKWSETIDAQPDAFVTGDAPQLSWMMLPAAASQTFVVRQVVGFNASGKLVPAVIESVDPEDDVIAIGFISYAPSAATTDGQMVGVIRQGVFNPNLLVFDGSYDTDEKKRMAFEGAPTPTSIILREPQTMTV